MQSAEVVAICDKTPENGSCVPASPFGDTFRSHGEGHMGPRALPQGDGWLSPGLTLEQVKRHPGYQKVCARADCH